MWCTIPVSAILPRLVALSAGLLVATLLAMLVGALPVAHASHVPDCWGLHPTNTPTAGNDVINGTAGDDVLAGGAGDDKISGFDGSDRLCGNEGTDTILGNGGYRDRIDGGPGDDRLGGADFVPGQFGTQFPECGLVSGFTGEPIPSNSPAYNRILGGPGTDRILGGAATDSVWAGDGNDCLMGTDGDDHLVGDSGADFISAGPGSDVVEGQDDYDDIFGGPGNPGSPDGGDVLLAGSTNVGAAEPQICAKNGELPSVTGPVENGDATRTPFSAKENFLVGDDGFDKLVGTNRADNMQGDELGDNLYGCGGEDFLKGNSGSDCLSGGPDSDELNDADPNNVEPDDIDTLWGGPATDTLNASDGDGFDALRGGGDFNRCSYDQGDAVSPWIIPSICF
jgi:Ca2+-binding RTX toxin-like protein